MVVSVSAIGYFLPIFSFLLVFIVLYAILKKTKILGSSEPMMLFISFILSSFFIMEASLVDFVRFNSAWIGVLAVMIFFLMALLAFLPGKEPLEFLTKGNWFSWVILGGMIAFFIFASAYTFNWVVNWSLVNRWTSTDWFGMVLLLLIALVVSLVLSKKARP